MVRGYPDFEGGKVKTFTVAEWAASEGYDKDFEVSAVGAASQGGASEDYTVPTGKTLYITDFSISIHAGLIADSDNNSIGEIYLLEFISSDIRERLGGNGGARSNLSKPVVFIAGEQLRIWILNWSNHVCDLYGSVHGYEL